MCQEPGEAGRRAPRTNPLVRAPGSRVDTSCLSTPTLGERRRRTPQTAPGEVGDTPSPTQIRPTCSHHVSGPLLATALEWSHMSNSAPSRPRAGRPVRAGGTRSERARLRRCLSSTVGGAAPVARARASIGEQPFELLFAAVMLSAWYGGLGPGPLSTVLGGLAADYYLELPLYSLPPRPRRRRPAARAVRPGRALHQLALRPAALGPRGRRGGPPRGPAGRRDRRLVAGRDSRRRPDGRISEWNQGAADLRPPGRRHVGQPSRSCSRPTGRELARVVERLLRASGSARTRRSGCGGTVGWSTSRSPSRRSAARGPAWSARR